MPNETPEQARQRWFQWIGNKVIGRPKATESHTVEELEAMGLIGIYSRE